MGRGREFPTPGRNLADDEYRDPREVSAGCPGQHPGRPPGPPGPRSQRPGSPILLLPDAGGLGPCLAEPGLPDTALGCVSLFRDPRPLGPLFFGPLRGVPSGGLKQSLSAFVEDGAGKRGGRAIQHPNTLSRRSARPPATSPQSQTPFSSSTPSWGEGPGFYFPWGTPAP